MASTINASTSSGIVQTADTSGVLQLQTAGTTGMAINASQQVSFPNNISAPNTFGFKNRIINGGMVINQRGFSGTVSGDPVYTLDRWYLTESQNSKFTISQNAGSITPPVGFTNYLGATVASAVTIGASDYFALAQAIEGFNVADLNFGSANAKSVTISFWVYSSLTGTFGASLSNGAEGRGYPFTYTISSANTWTQITQTIAGDTTGTYATGNTAGMKLFFGLGCGSTYSKTAGSWQAGTAYSATGATSVVGTNGATFYITGVQLEVGSQATSFDFRSYGTELALCQRYLPCWRVDSTGGNQPFGTATFQNGTLIWVPLTNPVPTRVPATGITTSGVLLVFSINNANTVSSLAFSLASTLVTNVSGTSSTGNASGSGVFAIQGAGSYIYGTGCEL